MQMNQLSLILKLQDGRMVFFSSFFFIPFDRLVLFKFFYLDPPLLRSYPLGCNSLVLLFALLVLMEHSLVLIIMLRWLFWELRFIAGVEAILLFNSST